MAGGDEQAGEKRFDPTPQKLKRLRDQGNVPKSREVAQIATFVTAVMYLLIGSNYIWSQIYPMFRKLWEAIPQKTLGAIGAGYIINYSAATIAMVLVPMFLLVALTAITSDIFQVGIMFSTQRLVPKITNLNPTNYFKNTFNVRGIVELLKQIAKVGILTFVAYFMIQKHWELIIGSLHSESLAALVEILKKIIADFTIFAAIALLVVAISDLFFQRFKFTQDNRMTLKEMMDEMKQTEGDPFVKAQRRALAKSLNQRRQVMSVPEADFITTNPSKIAVAVKYNQGKMSAPRVIAKGGDSFAWLIIATGKKHNIPIIENVPLARALYRLVKVDHEIPPELYRAVAEILLFAYQVRGKAKFK
ncbi:MAG: EscU/YscU/HrcU family type III secretion system export apparatus switch protein [Candidatus Caenarcaniphilales bacterium]|nr:EscU/YscU/HrcU family type III secretion system export apparatus switch protein [Candidatus Caenarcaniphilales bacterium]